MPTEPTVRTYIIRSPFWEVHDGPGWESFGEHDLPTYMERGSALFISRFAQFMRSANGYAPVSEKELHMMLDSLIHARSQVA